MNGHDGVRLAKQRADTPDQVGEGVAVLGKEHQFPPLPLRIEHRLRVEQQATQLLPLAVLLTAPHAQCQRFELGEGGNLGSELGQGAAGRGLVKRRRSSTASISAWGASSSSSMSVLGQGGQVAEHLPAGRGTARQAAVPPGAVVPSRSRRRLSD